MREELIRQLRDYVPFNEQEEADRRMMLERLENEPDVFLRSSLLYHMTASGWVTDPSRTRVVMAYHRIYDSWAWLGGHADGDEDLLAVALREVNEESGLRARPVSGDIFSVEALTVNGHVKRGAYVPSHIHLNVTYLLEADPEEALRSKEDENAGVAWFTLDGAVEASTEPWIREHVYRKLNEKLRRMA